MKLTFKFRVSALIIFSLITLAISLSIYFATIWVGQAKAYELITLSQRLETVILFSSQEKEIPDDYFEKNEWAFKVNLNQLNSADWIRKSDDLDPMSITKEILNTKLEKGAFEIKELNTLVHFKIYSKLQKLYVVGTHSHVNILLLGIWSAPFWMLFISISLLSLFLSLLLLKPLDRGLREIMDAMSKVGLGFGKGITLPVSSIPEISSLSKSLSDMMNSLSQKDQTINEVSNMADSDPMTDLPNVRAFKKYSMGLWSAIVSGHSGTTVLAIVDLDHFKKINDTFGHPVGDFVLKEVAKILKKTIRSDQFAEKGRLPDFAGRYGGEEFVVVFVNCQKDMYHKGALRLLQALCEKPLIVPKEICGKEKDLELKVTASIGISLWSNSRFKTVDEWMKDADDALYKSKNNGRARVNSNYPEAVEWLP